MFHRFFWNQTRGFLTLLFIGVLAVIAAPQVSVAELEEDSLESELEFADSGEEALDHKRLGGRRSP